MYIYIHFCCSVAQLCLTRSFTIYWNLLTLMSIESMMPFNHLVRWCPPLLPSPQASLVCSVSLKFLICEMN